jgi:hypothetical protein
MIPLTSISEFLHKLLSNSKDRSAIHTVRITTEVNARLPGHLCTNFICLKQEATLAEAPFRLKTTFGRKSVKACCHSAMVKYIRNVRSAIVSYADASKHNVYNRRHPGTVGAVLVPSPPASLLEECQTPTRCKRTSRSPLRLSRSLNSKRWKKCSKLEAMLPAIPIKTPSHSHQWKRKRLERTQNGWKI